eukprot:302498-Lingulodinium_polyedra.AAC.1
MAEPGGELVGRPALGASTDDPSHSTEPPPVQPARAEPWDWWEREALKLLDSRAEAALAAQSSAVRVLLLE